MKEKMKLNLGCGNRKLEGFINVDADASVTPDIVFNLRYNLTMLNCFGIAGYDRKENIPENLTGKVDEIVLYDVIEHFSPVQALRILKGCYEVLEHGGRLLVRTNDIDRLVRQYAAEKFLGIKGAITWSKFIWHLFCEPDAPNGAGEFMSHRWGYNQESLMTILKQAGFISSWFYSEERLGKGDYPYCEVTCDLTNMVVEVVK